MKKITVSLLCVASLIGLAACGKAKQQDVKEIKTEESSTKEKSTSKSDTTADVKTSSSSDSEKESSNESDTTTETSSVNNTDPSAIQFGEDVQVSEPEKVNLNEVTDVNANPVGSATISEDDARAVATDAVKRALTSLSYKEGNPVFTPTLSGEWMSAYAGERFDGRSTAQLLLSFLNRSTKEGHAWYGNGIEVDTPKEGDTYSLTGIEWQGFEKAGVYAKVKGRISYTGGSHSLVNEVTFVVDTKGTIVNVE